MVTINLDRIMEDGYLLLEQGDEGNAYYLAAMISTRLIPVFFAVMVTPLLKTE